MTKQTTSPRFAKKIAALKEAFDNDKCSHCGEAGNFLCTDDHHRFNPLCDDCYYDDEIREATQWMPGAEEKEKGGKSANAVQYPDGRHFYYEGDVPDEFVHVLVENFGLEPVISFHCPADLLDEIESLRQDYPLGT